jgi:hypothetical protein
MPACPKCGRAVEPTWNSCMSCGAPLAASPPPGPSDAAASASAPGLLPGPSAVRPPEPTAPQGRTDFEIPRYQGGTAPRAGAKPVFLIVGLLLVIAVAGVAYFLFAGGGKGSGSSAPAASTAPAPGAAPVPATGPTAAPATTPVSPGNPALSAAPRGVVDRAVGAARAELSQMGTDLKNELQAEWEAANTESPPEGATPEAQAAAARSQTAVRQALQKVVPPWNACFDEAVQAGAVTPLEVSLTIAVGAAGDVTTKASYLDPSTEPAGLTACLADAVAVLGLGAVATRGLTTTVTVPLRR